MANAESRMEHCVNFFSLRGKRKRQFKEYKKRVAIFQAMSSEELEFEYIMLKTEYANKKGVLTLFAVTVALTMLVGICNGFLGFMNNVLHYVTKLESGGMEVLKVEFAIGIIITGFMIIIILMALLFELKELKILEQDLMIVENVRKYREHQETDE